MPRTYKTLYKRIFHPRNFLILLLLTFFGSFYVLISNSKVEIPFKKVAKPLNYKFAYSQGAKLYIFDLNLDESVEIKTPVQNFIQFGWSRDGQLAFKDDKFDLYLAALEKKESKKIATYIKGYFFWKDDNSGIYGANYVPSGYVEGGDWQKTYFISKDGKTREISVLEYEKTESDQSIKASDNYISSYDKKLSIQIGTKISGPKFVLSESGGKTYEVPSKVRVKASGSNTYVAFKVGAGYTDLEVYSLDNIKNKNLEEALYKKQDVRDYAWIDDTRLILVTQKRGDQDRVDYIYLLVDISNKKEKEIYTLKNSEQGFVEVFPSPDMKRLAFQVQELVGVGKTRKYKSYLEVIQIEDGKEILKIPFDTGAWSGPLD